MNIQRLQVFFLLIFISVNGIAQVVDFPERSIPPTSDISGASPSFEESSLIEFELPLQFETAEISNNLRMGIPTLYVDIDAVGNNDGSSWTNAYNNLSDALENANLNDEIWVAEGTYLPNVPTFSSDPTKRFFLIWQDHQIYGGFNGTEVSKDQRDPSTNITILSGDINGDDIMDNFTTNRSDNLDNIILVNNTITDATVLDGFTIMGGHADGNPDTYTDRRGGGLFTYGPIELNNCYFTQNYAELFGGGAYYRGADSAGGRILNCIFEKNACVRSGGGVIIGEGDDITVTNCSFINNNAESSGGGFYSSAGSMSITGCSFIGNTSTDRGGGGALYADNTDDIIIVSDCFFDNNNSSAAQGGGLFFQTAGINTQCTVSSSTFSNNSSTNLGGGLIIQYGDYLASGEPEVATNVMTIVENCQFTNNVAGWGGGVSLFDYTTGVDNSFILRNCHVEENSATVESGGFYVEKSFNNNLSVTVSHTTFKNNESPVTLALAFRIDDYSIKPLSLTKVHNCVFDHDVETDGLTEILSGAYAVDVSNCTFNSNAIGILTYTYTDIKLLNNIFNTPEFENLSVSGNEGQFISLGGNIFSDALSDWTIDSDQLDQNPSFETGTFQLSQNSSAIDAGLMYEYVADFDLAGNDRIQGSCIDIGAYESIHDAGTPCISVGIKEEIASSSAMEIFPNPTSDVAHITLENDWNGTLALSIVNVLGQTVKSISIEKNSELANWDLDIKYLSEGTYKVLISNTTKMVVKTLVVIK